MAAARSIRKAVAVGLGLLFLLGKSDDAGATVVTSRGPRRAKFSSYDGDAATWAKRRYALAHDYFSSYWSKALDDDGVRQAALSVLAHWSLETGSGAGEYNFNVGNIHAVGSQPWFGSPDKAEKTGKKYGAQFAAYATLDEGIKKYFELLESSRYAHCLDALVAHPSDSEWVKCLGESDYYAKTLPGKDGVPRDNLGPAAAMWASKRATLAQYAN